MLHCAFFRIQKIRIRIFCELVVSVSLFNYLSSNSLVKSPSSQNHKKKLASSSLFLSSLSLRLNAASAAPSLDALSLSRNLLRSSLSVVSSSLLTSLSLCLSEKKNYEFVLVCFASSQRERIFFQTLLSKISLLSSETSYDRVSLPSLSLSLSLSISVSLKKIYVFV